jgi:NAD(P)-dependent dehydrogenase (short-subunit alcohol dehydrogenase family)
MASPETIVRINALGTVYVNQEFYKVMDGGAIVDIASQGGYILPGFMTPPAPTLLRLQTRTPS